MLRKEDLNTFVAAKEDPAREIRTLHLLPRNTIAPVHDPVQTVSHSSAFKPTKLSTYP